MRKLKIAMDFDDTPMPFIPSFSHWHNLTYETDLEERDFFCYKDFHLVLKVDAREAHHRLRLFLKSGIFENMPPVKEAAKLIRSLQRKGDSIVFLTARPDFTEDVTRRQARMHFPGVDKIYFSSSHYSSINNGRKSKGEWCCLLRPDLIVDDSLDYVAQCVEYCPAVLLNKPWNEGDLPRGVVRAHSFADVRKEIENIRARAA